MKTLILLISFVVIQVSAQIAQAATSCQVSSNGKVLKSERLASLSDPQRGDLGNALQAETSEQKVSVVVGPKEIQAQITSRPQAVPGGPMGSSVVTKVTALAGATLIAGGEFVLMADGILIQCTTDL